jgi:hypothetical protein
MVNKTALSYFWRAGNRIEELNQITREIWFIILEKNTQLSNKFSDEKSRVGYNGVEHLSECIYNDIRKVWKWTDLYKT